MILMQGCSERGEASPSAASHSYPVRLEPLLVFNRGSEPRCDFSDLRSLPDLAHEFFATGRREKYCPICARRFAQRLFSCFIASTAASLFELEKFFLELRDVRPPRPARNAVRKVRSTRARPFSRAKADSTAARERRRILPDGAPAEARRLELARSHS